MDQEAVLEPDKEKLTFYHINFFCYGVLKRVLGFFLALIALILLCPLMIVLALIIKIDSKGPAIFKQDRTGLNGKVFKLYKFRSMVVENDVHDFSKKDQHTKIGVFLRKTSLDELPQLINIIKGDMAFIGPRPWITDYYDNMNEEQKHRYDVLPGVTGLAQAKGRNNLSIDEKIKYDLEYIKHYSLYEDIKVVFLTIKAVLSKDGCDAGKDVIQKEINQLKKENKKSIK